MNNLKAQASSCTIIGDREYQQDLCSFENNNGWFCAVLCDGMGGMTGGELASRIGVETVLHNFRSNPPVKIETAAEWLRSTMRDADLNVARLQTPEGMPMGAGSTVIAVLISDGMMQWTCVGDSRIYIMRSGQLVTLTRMHNYHLQLKSMYRNGEISAEEMQIQSARGEALISYLGIGGLPIIDTAAEPLQLQTDDIIVLTSDGVYKSLDEQQVQSVIEEAWLNPDLIAQRLCSEAYRLAPGQQDNTTVVAIRMDGSL